MAMYLKYDLELSRRHCIIKSSRATSRVKWLKYENTDVSRDITALVLRVLKSFDAAGSPGRFYNTMYLKTLLHRGRAGKSMQA
jgi:hypothetical protein